MFGMATRPERPAGMAVIEKPLGNVGAPFRLSLPRVPGGLRPLPLLVFLPIALCRPGAAALLLHLVLLFVLFLLGRAGPLAFGALPLYALPLDAFALDALALHAL